MTLADDPLWQRLNDQAFRCPCCGASFNGVFDIAYDHPDAWPHGSFRENGGETVKVGKDKLGSDLCVLNEDRFVRGIIEIPILGSDTRFGFGAWVSLHPDNFQVYVDAYGTENELKIGPYFGWLSNNLPVYGTGEFLKTEVVFQGGGKRPRLNVWDESSTLQKDQKAGMSFSELLDLYAASGNDIRPHLMNR